MKQNPYLHEQELEHLQTLWNYLVCRDELPERADAIVVGGAAYMTDMAQCAAELYHRGISDRIVVTGYRSAADEMQESEAALLKRVLVADGVPAAAIILDEAAANTGQNITHAARLLSTKELRRVVLVHKPFMTRRFLATAPAQWPKPQPELFVTSIDMSFRDYFRMHHQAYPDDPLRIVRSMLGEYERIKSYPSQGLSSEQPASPEAERAYRQLLTAGFSAR